MLKNMDGGLWHCTGGGDQNHPQEKEMQKGKWLSEEVLQIAEKEEKWKAKEKWIYSSEGRISKNSKEKFESFPKWTVQKK